MLYVLDFIGIGFNLILLGLYSLVTYFVYQDMYKFIIFHLDGNRTMWMNFREITTTRGIMKLDILANLEFFSSFSFILFRDNYTVEPSVWGTLLGLFVFSIIVQLYGSYGTVSGRICSEQIFNNKSYNFAWIHYLSLLLFNDQVTIYTILSSFDYLISSCISLAGLLILFIGTR